LFAIKKIDTTSQYLDDLSINVVKHTRALRQLILVLLTVPTLLASAAVIAAPEAEAIRFWDDNEPGSRLKVDHSKWQKLLDKYLDDQHASGINRFDYASVTAADTASLSDYISYLLLLEPRQLNPREGKAYWINLYNANVVQNVIGSVKGSGVSKVDDVRQYGSKRRPWRRKIVEFLGQKLSLYDITNGVLRPQYGDRRIHYALTGASLSSPNLQKMAFSGDNIEQLLVQAEREYLSHPRAVKLNGSSLQLSEIFKMYDTDFAANTRELFTYLREFVSADVAAAMDNNAKVEFVYDWNINQP